MGSRLLVVVADDFGIGPATTRGILELASRGRVTGAALLVNSPDAAQAVDRWRAAGCPVELGWHACLTLDRPIAQPRLIPSLVDRAGCFHSRGDFLRRLLSGGVRASNLRDELAAQQQRFIELCGAPPRFVNSHHHLHVFPSVRRALRQVLELSGHRPYVRRVRVPARTLAQAPFARAKRAFLSLLGRGGWRGFPGNDFLVGVTDPPSAADPRYFARWLAAAPGQVVELVCHPGHWDRTLMGRDGTTTNGWLEQRVREHALLADDGFADACRRADFRLAAPTVVGAVSRRRVRDAA